MVKDIEIINYDYPLSDSFIPRHPLAERDSCRMIVSEPDGYVRHARFSDLPKFLSASKPLLVCNDTRVINARISFRKTTGGVIEVFLLEPIAPHDYVLMFQERHACRWKCMVGNAKRWKDAPLEMTLEIGGTEVELKAEKTEVADGNTREVIFSWTGDFPFSTIIEKAGFIPIPPYLKRDAEEIDLDDYQTVFSRFKGSVAAPTAGLHFTTELIDRLRREGVGVEHVTLHVGAGTFLPVKSQKIGDHPMHTEVFTVSRQLVESLIRSLEESREILAVGTTTVRTLESLPLLGRHIMRGERPEVTQWEAYDDEVNNFVTIDTLRALLAKMDADNSDVLTASTSIMIAPGFKWRVVGRLITNFHQPQSTLLLLVDSFLGGREQWKRIYGDALDEGYRFLSYGDACLLNPLSPEPSYYLPGSKSIAARVLTASLITGKVPSMVNFPDCDDTSVLADAVRRILNCGTDPLQLDVREGGTTFRFLLAAIASLPGKEVTLHPGPVLLNRPISRLIEALSGLGADITRTEDSFIIRGKRLSGGEVTLDSSVSSQFVSALMLAAPVWEKGVTIHLTDKAVSFPYILMTAKVMRAFGVGVEISEDRKLISVSAGKYEIPDEVFIEPDWSSASYFFEEEYIRGVEKGEQPHFSALSELLGLVPAHRSLQGDSVCCDIFRRLYSTPGDRVFEYDFRDVPDLVPAVAVAAAVTGKSFRFSGVGHLRFKESDRIAALTEELKKLGCEIKEEEPGVITFNSKDKKEDISEKPVINPHSDHRIAMAFTPLIGRKIENIENPEVVSKSFPGFGEVFPHPCLRKEDEL